MCGFISRHLHGVDMTFTGRILIIIGLLLIAIGLIVVARKNWMLYAGDRNKYFLSGTQPGSRHEQLISEMKANDFTATFFAERGLTSLNSSQVRFEYTSNGIGSALNQFVRASVASTDFDVHELYVRDFSAAERKVTLVWQLKPKEYGIANLGTVVQFFHIDPKTNREMHNHVANFSNTEIYVDPPLLSVDWTRVHLGISTAILASFLAVMSGIAIAIFADVLKAWFGLSK